MRYPYKKFRRRRYREMTPDEKAREDPNELLKVLGAVGVFLALGGFVALVAALLE